ncbi:hypothetical protein ACFXTH_005618 [Malus domestica]
MKSVQLLENLIGALANVGAIAFSTLDMLPTVLDDLGDNSSSSKWWFCNCTRIKARKDILGKAPSMAAEGFDFSELTVFKSEVADKCQILRGATGEPQRLLGAEDFNSYSLAANNQQLAKYKYKKNKKTF